MADRSPLLRDDEKKSVGLVDSIDGRVETQFLEEELEFLPWLKRELKQQFLLAVPMIIVNLMQFGLSLVSVMFVGHLGELSLASASLATSLAGVTGFSLMIGMSYALETLCGQAVGAKEYRMVGIFTQRAIFSLCLLCIPLACLWFNMAPILKYLGQDPEISELAGVYARLLVPTLFAYAFLEPIVRFLQTQSRVIIMAALSGIVLLVHIPVCWVLVFKVGLGYRGAAVANGISQWFNVLLLILYIKFSAHFKETWTGFSWEALRDFKPFFKLAIPATAMVCLENWTFELVVLLSGLLPNPELEMSSLSICLNTMGFLFMIPLGLSSAVSTRVSNELGARRPRAARAAVGVTIGLALIEGLITASILLSMRNTWSRAYTTETEVIEYVSNMTPFLSLLILLDHLQATISGVARGCGWQHIGAVTNLAAFYAVGIPVAVLLAFKVHMNGRGLWIGIMCGLFTQTVALSTITWSLNWEKQVEFASNRLMSETPAADDHIEEEVAMSK